MWGKTTTDSKIRGWDLRVDLDLGHLSVDEIYSTSFRDALVESIQADISIKIRKAVAADPRIREANEALKNQLVKIILKVAQEELPTHVERSET